MNNIIINWRKILLVGMVICILVLVPFIMVFRNYIFGQYVLSLSPANNAIISRYPNGLISSYVEIDSNKLPHGLYISFHNFPATSNDLRISSVYVFDHGVKQGPYFRWDGCYIVAYGIYKNNMPYDGYYVQEVVGTNNGFTVEIIDENDFMRLDDELAPWLVEYSNGVRIELDGYNMSSPKYNDVIQTLKNNVWILAKQLK